MFLNSDRPVIMTTAEEEKSAGSQTFQAIAI